MQQSRFLIVIIIFCCFDSSLGEPLVITLQPGHQSLSISVLAEDSLDVHKSARVEVGLGFGIAGEGSGLSGRLAFSYLTHKWGALVRLTAFDGGEGTGSNWFGSPVEKFYDKAILLSHVISNKKSNQTIISAGVGWMNGSRLTMQGDDLENIGPIPGFAFELRCGANKKCCGMEVGLNG
jgi:hypothetical protein